MKKTNLMLKKALLSLSFGLCLAGCKETQLTDLKEQANGAKPKSAGDVQLLLAGESPFKVLSFNVRHNDAGDPQTITQRQGNIRQIIVDNNPDIFGVQEFSDDTFKTWFRAQMATLGYGEYFSTTLTATPKTIFFKNSRFTLERSGTVRLGASPIINTATWVVLLDNSTSNRYFISNSHWQFDSQPTRIANANALVAMVNAQNTDNLPVIVFGDFNAKPGTTEINALKDGLDVVDALGDSTGDPTFHGWTSTGTNKIDWIMSDRSMGFTSWNVITTSYGGYWPSDHWPVIATYVPGLFGGPHTDANGKSANANTKFYFADIDGDGKKDKVYWNPTYDSGRPQVFLSNGNGTFASPAVVHTASASTLSTTRYHFADVNGDGKADLILWDPTLNSGHTRVYLATTSGNFSSTVVDNPEGTSAGTTTVYSFADVNGDGKADKIYWNATFDSGKTRVYLATSGGSFSGTVVAGTEGASTTGGTIFYYADVNGDGKMDKILWHPTLNSGKTMVYLSDGDGTFTASSTFSNSGASSVSASTEFYFADINGDGRADKIYWRPDLYLGKLKVYYATTGSVFDGPIYSLRGTSQSANTNFYFADINGDGKADQIRWNYAENTGELRNYFAK
ncbi:endonuclease/exonuclease/phosphatase family metal-dependent hydrolase [Pedobacter sp. AK017]|uniref:FG-GAP-like repeat-containing protein n=1 Tax=Pedobacter sp. AK017 TaxID=2723073 RepID=UPI001621EF01|nr:FG-GAP-like repeat-containing protein [Pedobacter sp. AK017]MBB5437736.1 endonuclease/exonuclease/phosphatase family metal-dependent hydrolase [Pedobacter sp. AK017]